MNAFLIDRSLGYGWNDETHLMPDSDLVHTPMDTTRTIDPELPIDPRTGSRSIRMFSLATMDLQ
ncbi:MAG: hypothetical protein JSS72_08500 [Armatimonadetes bacterium]|nr:hypothetical protein [Armatimonadota bacterium]